MITNFQKQEIYNFLLQNKSTKMVKQKIIGKQELWGITQDMCISYCLSSDFPGTDK